MDTTAPPGTAPEALRERMVEYIKAGGHGRSEAVEEAMRTIPRHLFVPNASVGDAYADIAVITKSTDDGAALSCASVPTVVAMMLDQLDVRPGNRILEIGAGTGYNAALLAHLTGPTGQVTTVDIDPEVTAQAREALNATGNERVTVITRDGTLAAEENAPYDRIIFTVGSWDLSAALWRQLARGGRLVLPLRWRGQTRSVALVRDGDQLRSESVELCGFVPMVGQEGEHTGHVAADGGVSLYWDEDQPIDPAALTGVLGLPKTEIWSGETVGDFEPFDGLWLRLTGTEPGTCRIAADAAAVKSGLCKLPIPSRTPALVEGDSLAYFTTRRLPEVEGTERQSELGVIGHGPAGPQLAERFCEQIRAWGNDRDGRPLITAYQAGTPNEKLESGHVIDKTESRLVVSYG